MGCQTLKVSGNCKTKKKKKKKKDIEKTRICLVYGIALKQELENRFLVSPHTECWLIVVNHSGGLTLLLNFDVEGRDGGKSPWIL